MCNVGWQLAVVNWSLIIPTIQHHRRVIVCIGGLLNEVFTRIILLWLSPSDDLYGFYKQVITKPIDIQIRSLNKNPSSNLYQSNIVAD